ncbi:MAG: hypothetical protein KGR25_09925, partial [Chloroflexi bacterium]|nr:hypothetical protein [Chloroflexota bacterium]
MELILEPEATPTQDTGWRVGDVIKLELKIKNTGTASVATGTFNGVEAYVDMDLTKVKPVKAADFTDIGANGVLWDPNDLTNKPGFVALDGVFAKEGTGTGNGYIYENKYVEGGGVGRIDLEIGSIFGGSAWTVQYGTTATIGSFFVRVVSNPVSDTTYVVTLRDSNAAAPTSQEPYKGRDRNSTVADASSIEAAGANILGAARDAELAVKNTTVSLRLVPRLVEAALTSPYGPTDGTINDRRVGDIIPVDLVLTARTNVRYMNAISATATFNTSHFAIVQGATNRAEVTTTAPVKLDVSTFLLGASAAAGSSGVNVYTAADGTVALRVSGTSLGERATGGRGVYSSGSYLKATDEKVVGRFYVRPKYNGAATQTDYDQITLAAGPQLGVLRSGSWALDYQSTVKILNGSGNDGTDAQGYRVAVEKTTVDLKLEPRPMAGRTAYRVGDTVPVDVVLTAKTLVRNADALDLGVSLPVPNSSGVGGFVVVQGETGSGSKLAEVTGSGVSQTAHPLKVASGTYVFCEATCPASPAVSAAQTFAITGTTEKTASIDVKVTGKPMSLAASTDIVLGTFFVRPNYNSSYADITIKDTPASGIRVGTDALIDDYNIEVTKTDPSKLPGSAGGGNTRIAVTTTTATLSLVPTLPNSPTPLRIGDRIPVAVKILPTDARYIGHLKADIAIPAGDYAVVGFQSGATYTELTSAVVDAGASTFRTSTFGTTTAT